MAVAVIMIVASMVLAGCSGSAASQGGTGATEVNLSAPAVSARSKVRVAVIQDKSLSTEETRTPQLRVEDLEPVVELLGQVGGELGVGVIHDRSNATFVRLRIEAPPQEPMAKAAVENPLERRNQRSAYRKVKADFDNQQQAWQEEMQTRIGQFQSAAEPILAMEADAKRSPVWDAVKRTDLFLSESDSFGAASHRYAVLITDGIDDVGARPVPVHAGTRVLLVNGAGQTGALGVLKPQCFESIEAAIRYVVGLEAQK
jgi:hypothetical protein